MRYARHMFIGLTAAVVGSAYLAQAQPAQQPPQPMSFFITSVGLGNGAHLGGIAGADKHCQTLAAAAGGGGKTWHAYLSTSAANGQAAVNARDRIGTGPWYNAGGALVANNLGELHGRTGDAALFVDERGQRINGQWTGSPTPVQHDVLTGSNADGTLMTGFTCADWTSGAASDVGQVGHSDGMGPGQSTAGALASWNSAHANQNCADTAPRGGAGRIYCFAR